MVFCVWFRLPIRTMHHSMLFFVVPAQKIRLCFGFHATSLFGGASPSTWPVSSTPSWLCSTPLETMKTRVMISNLFFSLNLKSRIYHFPDLLDHNATVKQARTPRANLALQNNPTCQFLDRRRKLGVPAEKPRDSVTFPTRYFIAARQLCKPSAPTCSPGLSFDCVIVKGRSVKCNILLHNSPLITCQLKLHGKFTKIYAANSKLHQGNISADQKTYILHCCILSI